MHHVRRIPIVAAAVLLLAALAPEALAVAPFEPEAAIVRSCMSHPDVDAPSASMPSALAAAITAHLADPRLDGVGLGLSLWIEGFGEVEAVHPDLRLRPASNQKLLTAIAAFEVLGPDATFTTTLVASGAVNDGVLDGDLFLVGGGDPSLTSLGPHSLEQLAAEVGAVGIDRVRGAVVVDETRYDGLRRISDWGEGMAPAWVGSLSALMVDQNRYRSDAAFLSDPASANGSILRDLLEAAGIAVDGAVRPGRYPGDGVAVAEVTSSPVRDLVRAMLEDSDNTTAEMLVKEIGRAGRGVGSTASGMKVLAEVARRFCLPQTVLQYDGSGLSHRNSRSTRQWRQLLQAAQSAPWWDDLIASLPVAGETGTLQFRFRGTEAEGNLRAKTGTIDGLRALSGVLTTAGSRRVFFSAVIDDDQPGSAMNAIDELLVAVAADDS